MCFRAQNAKTAKDPRRQNVAKISKRRDPRDPSDEICGYSLTRLDDMVDEHRSSWRSAPHIGCLQLRFLDQIAVDILYQS